MCCYRLGCNTPCIKSGMSYIHHALTYEEHFISDLWAHNSNLVIIRIALMWRMITQSSHEFAHVATAELSWHVQTWDMIGSLESIWKPKKSEDFNFNYECIKSWWNGSMVFMCTSIIVKFVYGNDICCRCWCCWYVVDTETNGICMLSE